MPRRIQPRAIVSIDGFPQSNVFLVSCERAMGGSLTDHAVLRVDLSSRHSEGSGTTEVTATNGPLAGITNQRGKKVRVETGIGGQLVTLHHGLIEDQHYSITPSGRELHLISKITNKMFGQPLYGQRQLNVFSGAALHEQTMPVIANMMIFNPIVEGTVRGNMRLLADYENNRSLFIDIESVRTEEGIDYQNLPPEWIEVVLGVSLGNPALSLTNWTLAHAVRYLCVEANKDETHIANPTLASLETLFGESDGQTSLLRNHGLPNGLYLPEALDNLLSPYGYSWYTDISGDKPKIVVVRMGDGPLKTLKLQPPGQRLNLALTNVESVDLSIEDDDLLTQLRVVGARKQVEATWELVPAWSDDLDDLDEELMFSDTPEWEDHPENHRVWRDWVLNEGADYVGVRPEITEPTDLSVALKYFGTEDQNPDTKSVQVKRRRFLPTLTLGDGGKPIGKIDGVTVEYYRSDYEGNRWVEINPEEDPTWACRVLEGECGISFTGGMPPIELLDIYQSGQYFPRVRVTATIELDTPIEETYSPVAPDAVVPMTVLVDAPDRFHSRYYIDDTQDAKIKKSIYKDRVDEGELASTKMDSTDAIAAFAMQAAQNWARATVAGTARLEGINHATEYEIGDVIEKIEGHDLTLDGGTGYGLPFYPQIVGISYVHQDGQWMTLSLGAQRRTEQQVAESLGGTRRYRSPVHTKPDNR